METMFNSENKGLVSMMRNGNRVDTFPDDAVNLLLMFRFELEELFRDCGDILGIATVLWEDISCRLFDRGFSVTGKQCSVKWEDIYAEYLEIAYCDDESIVSGWRYFEELERFYKLRSKYIDSKILEDATKFLNSRSESFDSKTVKDGIDIVTKSEESGRSEECNNVLSRDDCFTLSNEEESKLLIEAINEAEKILEQHLNESSKETRENSRDNGKCTKGNDNAMMNSCWRYERSPEEDKKETGVSLKKKKKDYICGVKNVLKSVNRSAEKVKKETSMSEVFVRSVEMNFYWDSDATQCFLDLRLYLENSRETKLTAVKRYRNINAFMSQKMLVNGYNISEIECGRKWAQLMRYYNKEAKKIKKRAGDNQLQAVRKYFWQMDKVLKKSGLEISADKTQTFFWDKKSVRKLIGIRIPMENAFAMFKRYVILWQYVASQMAKYNFQPTYNECSVKWMELCDSYNICLETVNKGYKEKEVKWKFFQDMQQGFEQNSKSTKPIINYSCSSDLNISTEQQAGTVGTDLKNKSAQNLTSSTFIGGSETIAGTEFRTLDGIENLVNEKRRNSDNIETEACQGMLKTSIHQHDCSLKINIPGDPSAGDNLQINAGESVILCNETPRTPLLKFANEFEVKKQCEQSLSDVRVSESSIQDGDHFSKKKAAVGNDYTIVVDTQTETVWMKPATLLLIKLKFGRELKFKSLPVNEMNLWMEIARDMQSAGYDVSHEACATRWYQLIAAYKGYYPQSHNIMCSEYREQLKLMELPFTRDADMAVAPKIEPNANGTNSKAKMKFIWTEKAIKILLKLKFSKEILPLKKYGIRIANMMQLAGYPAIGPLEVTRKWAHMFKTYKKSLLQKEMGKTVKWQYFQLVHYYINRSSCRVESEMQKKKEPLCPWPPDAAQKLIDFKMSLHNSSQTSHHEDSSLLWTRIANAMNAEGYHVTKNECASEWIFLIGAYVKTKKELCSGNGALIGKYFIMMDNAMNKLNKSNKKTDNIEEPIDFSIARKKRKVDGEFEGTNLNNAANIHKNHNVHDMVPVEENLSKKVSENEERVEPAQEIVQTENESLRIIDKTVIDLSSKVAISCAEGGSEDILGKITESAVKNIYVNLNTDSCDISSRKEEREDSVNSKFELNRSQEKHRTHKYSIPMHGENSSTDKTFKNYDYIDNSKENLACSRKETRTEASCTINIPKRILCIQKPYNKITDAHNVKNDRQTQYSLLNKQILSPHSKNILIQDRSVNSIENNKKWSDVATHLLIDLKLQHNQKFPGWPRPDVKWGDVAAQLARFGYNYMHTECKQKWYSLKTTYEEKLYNMSIKKTLEAWPYFHKIDSIYKKFERLYSGFKWILPEKRAHDDDEEQFAPRKKIIVSATPSSTYVAPPLAISITTNTANVVEQKKQLSN